MEIDYRKGGDVVIVIVHLSISDISDINFSSYRWLLFWAF